MKYLVIVESPAKKSKYNNFLIQLMDIHLL